ncbi:MAG: cellulase family glycosylhydrolase [Oscillospiraceae bacterium]|nr:cellulase family glycosylhydrolase [Oscillospiraceae bacterium]
MKKTKLLSAVMAGMMMLVSVETVSSCAADARPAMRNISTLDLVKDMGIGINLGNTFESCANWYEEDWIAKWSEGKPGNYETAWGSPVITKEMIEGIAKEGFGVLRIPVAWSNMMEHDGTYTINSEYDQRVHEVVDWTLESGMYAIINIHWDGGWVNNFPDDKNESMKRYTHMWEQIADSFKDYDDFLIFESQNEELGWDKIWNPWGSTDGKAESYALCNEINQKFVDVIRTSGGNNAERHLLISGYNTGIDRTCDDLFRMPSDPANRMAISVHYYSPAGFAILEEDADWGKAIPTWGSDSDYASLRNEMKMMKTHFTDKGIPVIIGEYGCPTKNKEPESIRRFLSAVCEEAYKSGHCPVMWSTPGGHYDRDACRMADQELQKKLYQIGGKPYTPRTLTAVPDEIMGDVNDDGAFNISDTVLFQKWLLALPGTQLKKTDAADFCKDGKLNAYDLSLMKQALLKQQT